MFKFFKKDTSKLENQCFELSVANLFSLMPSGRRIEDGPWSAAIFFNILKHFIITEKTVIINFEGCMSVGSSFIHELATLIHKHDYIDCVGIMSDDMTVIDKYNRYMEEIVHG